MTLPKVFALVNPISGGISKEKVPDLLKKHFPADRFALEIYETQAHESAALATARALQDGAELIVVVGGDGTVNQVSQAMAHSTARLGIVPLGSGNGLARHHGIPMDPEKALEVIVKGHTTSIDTILLNQTRYVNMAGVGFDAHIGWQFAHAGSRGLKTYAKITIRELLGYKPVTYKIRNGKAEKEIKAFLISFANGSQWGNNATIAPLASTGDGKLELCIMKPFHFWQVPGLAIRLFNKSMNRSSIVETLSGNEFTVERKEEGAVHLDGEPHTMGTRLEVKVDPASLNLIIP